MSWFPSNRSSSQEGWHFDIISLVAVMGGSTVAKHRQAITASRFGIIPRLLPAPETFLEPERPVRLPSVDGVEVFGVFSGNHFTELNFFADVIHDTGSLQPYEFLAYRITYRHSDPESAKGSAKYAEQNDSIPQYPFSFMNLVTLISIGMTVGLFIWAGVIHDGVAMVGIGTMSLSTSTACLSARWRPKLSVRPSNAKVVPADVVISTRGGALVVVHCKEEIARELYGGVDTCDYVYEGSEHQLLLASSTIFLLASVLFFSNCGWTMQLAIGLAYIILNILYWVMSLVTAAEKIWDTGRYKVELLKATERQVNPKKQSKRGQTEKGQDVSGRRYASKDTKLVKPKITKANKKGKANYTETLWWAIEETGETDWVRKFNVAPNTPNWDEWLNEAKEKLKEAKENCKEADWDAVEAKDRWMAKKISKKTAAAKLEEIS